MEKKYQKIKSTEDLFKLLNGEVNVYAENALTDEITITPTDIKGDLCQEIDTVDDLNRIKELIK